MKKLLIISALLLSACRPANTMDYWMQPTDPEVRNKVFTECLQNVKGVGPNVTHYNDFDEVVQSCSGIADGAARYCPTGYTCGEPNTRADVRAILNKSEK